MNATEAGLIAEYYAAVTAQRQAELDVTSAVENESIKRRLADAAGTDALRKKAASGADPTSAEKKKASDDAVARFNSAVSAYRLASDALNDSILRVTEIQKKVTSTYTDLSNYRRNKGKRLR